MQSYPADPSIPQLLLSTGCPAGAESWAAASWPSTGNPPAVTLHGPLVEFIEEQIDEDLCLTDVETNPAPPRWFGRLHHQSLARILRDPEGALPSQVAEAIYGEGPSGSRLVQQHEKVGNPQKPAPDHLSNSEIRRAVEARDHLDQWWRSLSGVARSALRQSRQRGWQVADEHRSAVERLGPMGWVEAAGPPSHETFKVPLAVRAYLVLRDSD